MTTCLQSSSALLNAKDVVDSSANSRMEPPASGQLASVSGCADMQKLDHTSGLDSGVSSRGFITASPIDRETQPMTVSVPTPEVTRTGVDNIHGRSMAITESDDFAEFQDFTAALRTLRKSAAGMRARAMTIAATM